MTGRSAPLFFEQIKENGQNDADDDACGYGEVKLEVVFFKGYITRELAKPR